MPISHACQHCGQVLKVADNLAGRKIKCPACQKTIAVTSAVAAPIAVPVAAQAAESDDLQLLPSAGHAQAEAAPGGVIRCPGCGHDAAQNAVLCTACGYNFRTRQSVRGHVVKQPGVGKLYLGTWLKALFFLAMACAGAYAVYYAFYVKDLGKRLEGIGKPKETKSEEEAAQATSSSPSTPAAPQKSLIVVENRRFPKLHVFHGKTRVGTVELGQSNSFEVETGKAQVSFEVRPAELPKGVTLGAKLTDALGKGLAFDGNGSRGLRVVVKGPPSDAAPQPKELLTELRATDGIRDRKSGEGLFKQVRYKAYDLKPVAGQDALRTTWELSGSGAIELRWIAQEFVVSRAGKVLYDPAATPFEGSPLKIKMENGKPVVD